MNPSEPSAQSKMLLKLAVGVILLLALGVGVFGMYSHSQADEPPTKDLPAGYLRASPSFVHEFEQVEKAYTHLQARVPSGMVYDKALQAFYKPTAAQAAGAQLVTPQTGTAPSPGAPNPPAQQKPEAKKEPEKKK